MLLVTVGWLTPSDLLAQTHAVFLQLKGTGTGNSVTGAGTDVQVAGDFAYVVHPGGLEIYCVTNPVAPVRVSGWESQSLANSVELSGHYAYLALGITQTFTNDTGSFEIVDVGDPFNPVLAGRINTLARANDIRVAGNYAYVAESARWTGSNLLGALEIFEISTPTNPVRVATFETAGSATSVDVSGSRNIACLTDGVTDVQVLNVSDPSHPWRTGIYQPDLSQCAFETFAPADSVQVVGKIAYSTGGHGLNVLDISDPSQPVRILDNSCIPTYSFHVAEHYAFATIFNSSLNTFFLYISDTTNPTNWVTVGLQRDWQPARMQVVGSLIYVATNPLIIYELTNRPAIQSISNRDGNLTLVWDYAPGFVLQRTTSLGSPSWIEMPETRNATSIILPSTVDSEFFRLAKP